LGTETQAPTIPHTAIHPEKNQRLPSTTPLNIDFNQSNDIEGSETIKLTLIKLQLPGALLTLMASRGYGQQKAPRKQE
jgi:hypothetical protein